MSRVNLDELVELAVAQNNAAAMRPVVVKELLHYDILFALDKAGLLKNLVFQGGTSLRLCYGSNRFSEDLDFVGGKAFGTNELAPIKDCIEDYLGNRYGLEVSVKEPKQLREQPEYRGINVDKWQVSVTTAPEQKSIPRQRIKIEIANIEAYTSETMALQANYEFLPDGYADTTLAKPEFYPFLTKEVIRLYDQVLRHLSAPGAGESPAFVM